MLTVYAALTAGLLGYAAVLVPLDRLDGDTRAKLAREFRTNAEINERRAAVYKQLSVQYARVLAGCLNGGQIIVGDTAVIDCVERR